MRDSQLQKAMAQVMLVGTVIAAAIIFIGLVWYLAAHPEMKAGDHIFSGEPKYFENPLAMIVRAFDEGALGERRSVVMIGISLLLLNPFVRVGMAALGFAAQRDRLYTGISLIVLTVLVFSFFW